MSRKLLILDLDETLVYGAETPLPRPASAGSVTRVDARGDYVAHLLTYIDVRRLIPLKVVVNSGNGGAGAIIDLLECSLPFGFVKVNHQPDGAFPNGVPNPLLPENREVTSSAVVATGVFPSPTCVTGSANTTLRCAITRI